MKTRWPFKQTVPIRWSAPSWRPTIKMTPAPVERPTGRALRPRPESEAKGEGI